MSLNNKETPLLHRFWQQVGGTLIEEFYAVERGKNHSERRRVTIGVQFRSSKQKWSLCS
jgi:hypothetical protein